MLYTMSCICHIWNNNAVGTDPNTCFRKMSEVVVALTKKNETKKHIHLFIDIDISTCGKV